MYAYNSYFEYCIFCNICDERKIWSKLKLLHWSIFSVFVPYLALERKVHVEKHVFRKWFKSVYLSLLIVATNWCCGSKATPCTKLLCSGKIASRWPVMKSKYTCLILKIFVENCVGKHHLHGSHFSGLTKFPDFSSYFLMFCFF